MQKAAPLVEIWRGDFLESIHSGHAVVCGSKGEVIESWGDPEHVILPRSSCKMVQALPLVESGAANAFRLTSRHLALACASHNGAEMHAGLATEWLAHLGLDDDALRCGPQDPADPDEHRRLLCAGQRPSQAHNNCSGKHCGFLTLSKKLGAGPEYIDPTHPVQLAVRTAFEEVTEQTSHGFAIDGCSAPNFATTVTGLARAAASFASPKRDQRGMAQRRLTSAMMSHPELVAGEGRACTILMRAAPGEIAVKTGAEGVFVGILPKRGLGFAVKVSDGATRAAECVAATLLVRLGVLSPTHAAASAYIDSSILNRRQIVTGAMRPVAGLRG